MSALDRLASLQRHLCAAAGAPHADGTDHSRVVVASSSAAPSPSDVVVVAAVRTPICKAKRGDFKDTPVDILLISVMKAVMEKTGVSPSLVGDVVVGNVLQPGAGAASARMAQLEAGIPYTVPLSVVNRQCSSGLQVRGAGAGRARGGCGAWAERWLVDSPACPASLRAPPGPGSLGSCVARRL